MFWEGERRCRSRSWRDFHHLCTCEQAASSKNGLNAIREMVAAAFFKHFQVFEKYSKLFVENFNYSIFDIRRSTVHYSKFIIRWFFSNRSPKGESWTILTQNWRWDQIQACTFRPMERQQAFCRHPCRIDTKYQSCRWAQPLGISSNEAQQMCKQRLARHASCGSSVTGFGNKPG